MNQSQFLAITCNSLKAREKSRVHGAIGFGFASHWLKNWRQSFKPITKRSNRNHVITFDSHLKTALYYLCYYNNNNNNNIIIIIPCHSLLFSNFSSKKDFFTLVLVVLFPLGMHCILCPWMEKLLVGVQKKFALTKG